MWTSGYFDFQTILDTLGVVDSEAPVVWSSINPWTYNVVNADKAFLDHTNPLATEFMKKYLKQYVEWLRDRVIALRKDESYNPIFHIDVYGTIGAAFGNDNYEAMADYLAELEEAAKPFHLRIEGPMDVEDREKQMIALKTITKLLDDRHINVEIVADEWCNTLEDIKYFADNRAGHMVQIKTPDLGGINNIVEAVLYCKAKGIGAYQGGTCNETDRSAQVCVHCAMATRPVQILAKPGMGVDEGYMIVYNEMQRIIAMHKARQAAK